MGAIASQITSLTIVYSTVYSDADLRKHQSSASQTFVRGIHRGPVISPRKWPVMRKMFPFDDVIIHCSATCKGACDSIWSTKKYSPRTPFNSPIYLTRNWIFIHRYTQPVFPHEHGVWNILYIGSAVFVFIKMNLVWTECGANSFILPIVSIAKTHVSYWISR